MRPRTIAIQKCRKCGEVIFKGSQFCSQDCAQSSRGMNDPDIPRDQRGVPLRFRSTNTYRQIEDMFASGIDPGDFTSLLFPKDPDNLSKREKAARDIQQRYGIAKPERPPVDHYYTVLPQSRTRLSKDEALEMRRRKRLEMRNAERRRA